MADLVKQGALWLEGKRVAHRAITVTVWRGGLSFTAEATLGASDLTSYNDENVIVEEKSEDFTIAVADYDFGKGPVDPERGDSIEYDGLKFEVLPVASAPEARYSDAYRLSWRVHTKVTTT